MDSLVFMVRGFSSCGVDSIVACMDSQLWVDREGGEWILKVCLDS